MAPGFKLHINHTVRQCFSYPFSYKTEITLLSEERPGLKLQLLPLTLHTLSINRVPHLAGLQFQVKLTGDDDEAFLLRAMWRQNNLEFLSSFFPLQAWPSPCHGSPGEEHWGTFSLGLLFPGDWLMSIYLSVPWPLLSISLLSTLMTHVFNTVSHSLSLSFSQADYIRFSLSSTFSLLQLSHTRTFTCTHTHSLFLLTHTHTQSLTESICLSLLLLQLTVPPLSCLPARLPTWLFQFLHLTMLLYSNLFGSLTTSGP